MLPRLAPRLVSDSLSEAKLVQDERLLCRTLSNVAANPKLSANLGYCSVVLSHLHSRSKVRVSEYADYSKHAVSKKVQGTWSCL